MERRTFLKAAGHLAAGYALASRLAPALYAAESTTDEPALPRRVVGTTSMKASIVGFPGLGLIHHKQPEGTALLHKAFEQGVNYFDVAPAYGNGDAETKMGIGLQGLPRDRYYLACKTKMRDAKGAREELERSLRRLKTDHFDVYQMHHLRRPEEVEQAFGPDGAMEVFTKARQEGKVRFFGFSAHTTKAALLAMEKFRFDTVMFPINYIEYFKIGFGKPVLELARKQGLGVLAIKPMCGGAWPPGAPRSRQWWYRPLEDPQDISMALRFTLSQEPVAVGFPPGWLDLADKAVQVGRAYRSITEPETDKLRQMAAAALSIFEREEQQIALGKTSPAWPDSPHECAPIC